MRLLCRSKCFLGTYNSLYINRLVFWQLLVFLSLLIIGCQEVVSVRKYNIYVLMDRHVNFKSTWKRLEDTVLCVLLSLPLERSVWNERFSDVYSICNGNPDSLSGDLYKEAQVLLSAHVDKLHHEVANAGTDCISLYSKHWLTYRQGAKYLDLLFHHFNQQYIQKSRQSDADIEYGFPLENKRQLLEIGELALETWKEKMIIPLSERLVDVVLGEIQKDRNRQSSNDADSLNVILSFVFVEEYKRKNALKFYEDVFEKRFLQETNSFYREKASTLRVDATCSEYMKMILSLLTDEEVRSRKFLHQSSYKKATIECQQRVIFDHVQFLQAGCRDMIRKDARGDLLHMYLLLKSAPDGLSHLVAELEAHIKETGLELVKGIGGGNVPLQFVETILEVHKRFSDLVKKLFHSDKQFVHALDRACVSIVNYHEPKQPCRAAEMVCKYCDNILRRCSRGSTDEADEKLQSSIIVFRYIDDKDVFQKFYSRALAKRLINSTCVMEMEEQMINRLKDVCGYDFTSKLHSMFTDVRMSGEHTKNFHEKLTKDGDTLPITMNVNILQSGAWPLNSNQSGFNLPELLLKCIPKFENFYSKQFNGRNLSWLHHLSQAEVRMQTATKAYYILMSTYQLSVILLLNDENEITYEDITKSTKLEGKDLDRNVQALVDAKILLKIPPIDETKGKETLSVNVAMVNKKTRFKIAVAPTQREQVTETQQTHTSIQEDRKLYLQAAIVRIMKARRTINHNSLMEEVITKSRMRFTPCVSAIKRSIESLIEKSYLRRDPDAADTYLYIA